MVDLDTVTSIGERTYYVPRYQGEAASSLSPNEVAYGHDAQDRSNLRLGSGPEEQRMHFEPASSGRGGNHTYLHGIAEDPVTRERRQVVIMGGPNADMEDMLRNGRVIPVQNGMDPEAVIHRLNVGDRAGMTVEQRIALANRDVTSPERIREAANALGARQIPDMGLTKDRQELPRTATGVNTQDGAQALFTPQEMERGKNSTYITGQLTGADGVSRTVIVYTNRPDMSLEGAQQAFREGHFVEVPDNMHRDDIRQRLEVADRGGLAHTDRRAYSVSSAVTEAELNAGVVSREGGRNVSRLVANRANPEAHVAAVPSASAHVVRTTGDSEGLTAFGISGDRSQRAGSSAAAAEFVAQEAARNAPPPTPDNLRQRGGLGGAFSAGGKGPVMAIAGAVITGVMALSNGASAAEAGRAAGVELVEAVPGGNVITTATGVGREQNVGQAYFDAARIAVGGAMGAKMGAAAGTALLGPGGTLAGGFIGGAAGAGLAVADIDVGALPRAVEQGHRDRMDRESFIREVAGMSADDIRKIEDPGLRQTVTDVREALVVRIGAQAQVDALGQSPRGNAGARQSATRALEHAQGNLDSIVTMNLTERNDEGTGMGNRMMALMQDRAAQRDQQTMLAQGQQPQQEATVTQPQQRQPLAGMNGMG